MKKNFLFPFVALFTLLFASCSQEEIVSNEESKAPITLSVNAPVDNAVSRAATLDGYTLTCIMQLLNATGDQVGTQMTAEFSGNNATFTFDPTTATQALFWAEYRKAGSSVYNTSDLKNVRYSTNAFDLSKATDMSATDAFCGKLTSLSTTTVTLKRPFAKLNVKAKNPELVAGYTGIAVAFNAPSGYSVLNQTTASTAAVTFTNASGFNPANTWFSVLVFAPVSEAALGQNITITLSGSGKTDKVITLPGAAITTDDNKITNVSFDIENTNNITVTVGIDDEFETVAMAVGDYIYKDGNFGKTYNEDVIAIVYALAGKTDASDYGVGKTIAGYAMAVTCPARALGAATGITFPTITKTGTGTTPWADDYNGLTYTNALITGLGDFSSPLFDGYKTWVTTNTFTGTNLSDWYIPSGRQLLDIAGMIFGWTDTDPSVAPSVAKDEAFRAAYDTAVAGGGTKFNSYTAAATIISSYLKQDSTPAGVMVDKDNTEITGFAGGSYKLANASFIRPVLTVFK